MSNQIATVDKHVRSLQSKFFAPAISGLVAIAIFSLVGCEHADPFDPGEIPSTLTSIQADIFNVSCAVSGCHAGSSAPWGLDLSAGASFDNLVGRPAGSKPGTNRVSAGDADGSYLIHVLEGGPDITVPRMPFGIGALPDEQVESIREWINDGAKDN